MRASEAGGAAVGTAPGIHRLHRLEGAGDRGDLAGECVQALPEPLGRGLLLSRLGGGADREHLGVKPLERVEQPRALGLEARRGGEERGPLVPLLLERLQSLAQPLAGDRVLLRGQPSLQRVPLRLEPSVFLGPGEGADLPLAAPERVHAVAERLYGLLRLLDDLPEHRGAAPDVREELVAQLVHPGQPRVHTGGIGNRLALHLGSSAADEPAKPLEDHPQGDEHQPERRSVHDHGRSAPRHRRGGRPRFWASAGERPCRAARRSRRSSRRAWRRARRSSSAARARCIRRTSASNRSLTFVLASVQGICRSRGRSATPLRRLCQWACRWWASETWACAWVSGACRCGCTCGAVGSTSVGWECWW